MSEKPANQVEEWYLKERGITPETLHACKVETTDTEARWKVGNRYKIRTGFAPGEKRVFKYSEMGQPNKEWSLPVRSRDYVLPVIACEGETDAMCLWQKGGKDKYGSIVAVPGCDALTESIAAVLAKRAQKTQLYFVLDNEQSEAGDYNPDDWKEAQQPIRKVDESWQRIKKLLPKARRIYLPDGYKDLCEYFRIYDIKDFDEFVVNAEARYNYNRLDLSGPASEMEWLWNGVVPRGQFGVLQGESNVGKSMLYQALAVALANGDSNFLKRALNPTREGRVFIVDNENPEEVIRERYHKMGLKDQKKLYVVSNRGVRLDVPGDAGKLYEDVSNFNPDIVFLDSFVRLHMQDENSSAAISGMYNSAVLPLSRDLGTAVVLLHHVNKTSSGDSRQRTRGSTDITAGCDFAWDMVEGVGEMSFKKLVRFKTRSGPVFSEIKFQIEDTEEGGLDFPIITTQTDVL